MSVKYFFRICNIVRVGDKGKYIGKRLWPTTGDGRREGKRAGDKHSETFVNRGDCEQQGGKLLRIFSQLRPRIRPLHSLAGGGEQSYHIKGTGILPFYCSNTVLLNRLSKQKSNLLQSILFFQRMAFLPVLNNRLFYSFSIFTSPS